MMRDKVSLKNLKDKKFEEHKGSVFNLLEKAAKNLFEDKHFHEEFKGVFAFSSFLKIIASIVSFCTGFIALQIATKLLFGYWASSLFALTVCVSLEAIKAFFWRINSKWFLKYRKISKAILFSLVGLHLVSLVFSAYGGWMLPTMVDAPSVESVPKVNEDSISQPYLSAIALIDEQLKSNNLKLSENQSNSTIRTFNKNIETLLSQKTAKETALNLAILSAKEERSTEVQKKQEKLLECKKIRNKEIKTARISCLIASVFFELLFVICSCFCVYYLFRLNIDLSSDEEHELPHNQSARQSDSVETVSKHQGHGAPPILEQKTPPKPATIGFVVRCLDSKEEQPKECFLDGCSERWTKGAHNKKYCSNECRQLAHQIKKHRTSKQPN